MISWTPQAARTRTTLVTEMNAADFAAELGAVEVQARSFLDSAGVPEDQVRAVRHLDMRYRGQGYEIEVELSEGVPAETIFPELPKLFAARYEAIFALSYIHHPVEIVNWKVEALGPRPGSADRMRLVGTEAGASARKGTRRAYFPDAGGFVDCPVYDRYALRQGEAVEGPALVEEREATLVLGPGDRAALDELGNLIVDIGAES